MKEDLQKRVIRDGSFVFPKVHELIFAASALNSAGMSEAISIAEADAHQQNIDREDGGFTLEKLAAIGMIFVVLLVGGGIAVKVAFG